MTLDLLGDWLMLFASVEEPARREKAAALNARAPVIVATLEAPVAPALEILDRGALLLRPDGHAVCTWRGLTRRWMRACCRENSERAGQSVGVYAVSWALFDAEGATNTGYQRWKLPITDNT